MNEGSITIMPAQMKALARYEETFDKARKTYQDQLYMDHLDRQRKGKKKTDFWKMRRMHNDD